MNICETIFRSYDIRGIYPSEIDENTALIIGKSYGSYIQEKYNKNTCIVSGDIRLSTDALMSNLIKGIISTGCNVINYGITTTPMNYYIRFIENLPGVMVTASHNPKDDNGFKFSFDGMINARGEMIEDFKNYTLNGKFLEGNGKVDTKSITSKYIEHLKYSINFGKNKRKIVIDPGNGVASLFVKEIFDNTFCDAIYINDKPDGNFPNHHPDPAVLENMVQLQKAVLDNKADFGVAYDGDADRIGVVTDKGEVLPIEYFMILAIKDMFGSVKNKTFLYDVKCSKSIEDVITSLGGTPYLSRTGASFTQLAVHENNLPFGGEFSGHIYFNDRDKDCGSAIYATLRLLEIMSKTRESLSSLVEQYPKYFATEEIRIHCDDLKKGLVVKKVYEYAKSMNYPINDIDGVRITYTNGWALVRQSNTGPNLIFRGEATSELGKKCLEDIYIPLINKIISEL